jgi:outer membrane protein assembly factor BamB
MTLAALIVSSPVLPVAGADTRVSGMNVMFTSPQCCANAEWSMFKKGADRAGRTGHIGPQTPHVQWDHSLSLDDIQSPAAIAADGTIYAGSVIGRFYAFRPDGSLKWIRKLSRFEITSAPAIGQDGTVYIAPENSDLYALDPNGVIKWRFPKVGNGGPSASPVIGNGGTIYIGANFFYAVRTDGTLRWKYDTGSYVSGPPAIGADGTIYFPSNYYLYALHPDGSLKWRLADRAAYPLGSAPAVGADGTIYANTNDGVLHAIRPNGTLRWKFKTEGIVVDVPSSPAIALDGTVYFGGGGEYMGKGGYFYAVHPDGSLRWKYFAGCDQTAPSIGGDGTIYFGSDSCGAIHALNPDGTPKWSYFRAAYTRSAPAIGRGQRLYTGYLADPNFSQNGGLLSFGP